MADRMTPRERIEAVIRLEQPDRVPVAPLTVYYCAYSQGVSTRDFLRDMGLQVQATERTFAENGGWDAWAFMPGFMNAGVLRAGFPLQVMVPGEDLPDDAPLPQLNEREVMTPDDYDAIVAEGYGAWYKRYHARLYPSAPRPDPDARARTLAGMRDFYQKWAVGREVPVLYGTSIYTPFEVFSFARTFYQFSLDLARRPNQVRAACLAGVENTIERGIKGCQASGTTALWVGGWRSNASFISPRQFERFVLPDLKLFVNEYVAAGLTPVLHFDANWTPMLPFLRELPARACVLQADQETDLAAAKQVLGDHMALMGNVNPRTLALGTVDQVVEECKHLIDTAGAGGGLILSSGCEVPYNAPPANLTAMVETAKTYGVYRR